MTQPRPNERPPAYDTGASTSARAVLRAVIAFLSLHNTFKEAS